MLKRSFDVVASLAGLMLLSPILAIITVAVILTSRGPVFYRGTRVGKRGELFSIFKFRTMAADAEKAGASSTASDDRRLTSLGRLLRRFKLDELPQLFNVLKGDMSLVGPRPQVPWAVQLYTEEERALLNVRPGITDYASIRFRNEAEILVGSADPDQTYIEKIAPEKNRLALYCVRRQSLGLDLRILATTLWTLLGGQPKLPQAAEAKEQREPALR